MCSPRVLALELCVQVRSNAINYERKFLLFHPIYDEFYEASLKKK